MARFKDQVAIITGAGSGIGACTARLFAAEGASVVLVGLRRADLDRVAADLQKPDRVAVVAGDVRDEETARAAVAAALEKFGRLDVLVSNAAMMLDAPLPETNLEKWRAPFDVITMGAFHFCRHGSAAMIAKGIAGRIVTVTSTHGTHAAPRASNYGAAKAALNQFTRCLAVELAPHGIRANAVAPGFVDTPMSVNKGVNWLHTEGFRRCYVETRRIPLARAGMPEEIAPAILFLASAESSYITGHVLVVDGGMTCTF